MTVGHSHRLRGGWRRFVRTSSFQTIKRVVMEQAIETVNIETKAVELRAERRSMDKCDLVVLANIRSQEIQVAGIVTTGKEYVFTLVVLDEQTEHLADLVVRIFFLVTCIHKVEEVVSAREVGTERTQRACLVSGETCTCESLGQASKIGVCADHDFAVLILTAVS